MFTAHLVPNCTPRRRNVQPDTGLKDGERRPIPHMSSSDAK
jgi:hypothetical protein